MIFSNWQETLSRPVHFYLSGSRGNEAAERFLPFVHHGLTSGKSCLLFLTPETERLLRSSLAVEKRDEWERITGNGLRYLNPDVKNSRNEASALESILEAIGDATSSARGPSWVLLEALALYTPLTEPERLARFEGELDRMTREKSLVIGCLFDEETFPASFLYQALLCHEGFVREERLVRNPLFLSPSSATSPEQTGPPIDRFRDLLFRQEQSSHLYRVLAERSFAGVYVVQKGRFRYINPKAASYAGYEPEEMTGRESMTVVLPEDRPEAKKNALGMLRGHRTAPYEFRILRKDGKIRWIMETLTPILFEGKPAILGNSMDITEKIGAEESLRESERRFREIIDFLPDATFVIDREKRVVAWNRAIEEMTGIMAPDIIGKKDQVYAVPFHGKKRPILIDFALSPEEIENNTYTRFENKGSLMLAEMEFLSPKGEKRFLWLKASPIYDGKGTIAGAIETIRDITDQKRVETLLKIEKARMEELFETAPEAVILADPRGILLKVNRHFTRLFGYTPQESYGKSVDDLIIPPDRTGEATQLTRQVSYGAPVSIETVRKNKDGDLIEVSILATPLRIDEGQIGIYAIYRDISDRKRAEAALRENEERYRTIIETIEDGYYEADAAGRIAFVNDSLLRILAFPREEILGRSFRRFTDRENGQKIWLACYKVYETGEPCHGIEWAVYRKDGEKRSVEISISLIRDGSGKITGFRGILRDITERIRSEETIRNLAYHDVLTGLPNRFLFQDRLSMAIAGARRSGTMVAVIMLDLDKFKEVNDTLGHPVGDLLLQAVAERLKESLRRGDTIARMGGDEFMIVAPDIKTEAGARTVGEKIVAAVRNPLTCGARSLSITTSLGVALYPLHSEDPDVLVQYADIAMYRAKKAGRDLCEIYRGDP